MIKRILCLGAALLASTAARADDTEIFVSNAAAAGLRPNILFIFDTSGSMNSLVTLPKAPYNPAQTYGGSCSDQRFYFAVAAASANQAADIPTCSGNQNNRQDGLALDANTCAAGVNSIAVAGLWTGRAAQWNPSSAGWSTLSDNATDDSVECEADAGVHGANASSTKRYAQNGDPTNRWTSLQAQQIGWASATVYTLYSANWLNWYYAPPQQSDLSRLQTVQSVATSLASSTSGINLGLMRFSNASNADGTDRAEGGMVTHEIADVATARGTIVNQLNSYTAGGLTPLSETLYEAGQYFAGRAVDYGVASQIDSSTPFPSVAASRLPNNPANYKSPVSYQCQKNYALLLTDGEPTEDNSADSKIVNLPDFQNLVGGDCDGNGPGRCLDDMAEYLNKADLSPEPGKQNVITYAVGFGPDVAGTSFLERTAARGGGRAYEATNVTELTNVLQQIVSEIMQSNGTFTAPALSINAFNRSQTTNDFYVSLFKPSDRLRWAGNVKKYSIRNAQIVDAAGQNAIDPATGFFREDAQSLWSSQADGADITRGGAVGRQPAPAERKLYTYLAASGTRSLIAPGNQFNESNNLLTADLLGIASATPTREQVIAWAQGFDAADIDGDGNTTEAMPFMGDPLHAKPTVLNYGGSTGTPDPLDAVVYTPTNDGFLHATDAKTGRELWAFIPSELLGRMANLYVNPAVAARTYGLDGDIRLLRFDANQDGVLDTSGGDRAILYFGMRRGGRYYYALDVTNRAAPQLLWSSGPSALPGIGETWSPPTVARVNVGGAAQNGEKLVLIMGGGYDGAQENYSFVNDSSGNRIFMIDAISGALLWYAGGTGGAGSPDLELDQMRHSIPSRITVLDTDGDQYVDRMYTGDMGGRVWRFDIFNGSSRGSLVTGGVLATLGNGDTGTTALASNRRFYNAPDVALIQRRATDPYYNIAIGSGYRGHPLENETRDRFYALRDKNPFGKLTQLEYNNLTPVTDVQMTDVTQELGRTVLPQNSPGWKLELRRNGGWVGEKVLADAVTLNGTVLFTTYQPERAADLDPCLPANGRNRVYALKVDNAAPALDLNDNRRLDDGDLSQDLAARGIAGEVTLVVESRIGNNQGNAGDELGRRSFCAVGVEVLSKCVNLGGVVRTFWQRSTTDRSE